MLEETQDDKRWVALENECNTLYSEDMQQNQLIDGKLKIINPFL
jgi:predicted nucleic acid-binding protein